MPREAVYNVTHSSWNSVSVGDDVVNEADPRLCQSTRSHNLCISVARVYRPRRIMLEESGASFVQLVLLC